MPLGICEGSACSVRAVYYGRVMELRRGIVLRLVKELPVLVLVVKLDTFHASFAWADVVTALRSAADTITYHDYFVGESHNLSDGIHYLLDLKPRFL